ncbi:hypothetical protein OHA72_35710 [Dactylosporangium sp. NBC_01737]|uniref:hypothetical protein n=1 Tax=Dactylosporangium sp. NBC_01737 TaxID=2975959 RepID=UPI002E1650E9|nr:hypothetical protein OHA72_35710 [Dactylosporangium sp. NBC_01737]
MLLTDRAPGTLSSRRVTPHEGQGRPEVALEHSRQALRLYRVLGHRAGQAR